MEIFLTTTERKAVFSKIGRKVIKIVVCAVPPQFPEVNPEVDCEKYDYLVICDSKKSARKEAKKVQEKCPYDKVVILKETIALIE